MVQKLRGEVLRVFRLLHRTSQATFQGDTIALNAARCKINEEFKRNKLVDNSESITELLKFAKDVEKELRTTVVQAKQKEPGVYQLLIREDTIRLNNATYPSCPSSK